MEFTEDQVFVIQSEFRKFPRYPAVVKLASDFKTTVSEILEVINRNERIGAFLYRNSVYTWRHIRQFGYLITQGTPKNEIMSIMGIGSENGWKLFYDKLKQWTEIEKEKNKGSRIENKEEDRFNFEGVLNVTTNYDINSDKIKEIIRLTGIGCSQRSIAGQIGVSKSYVQQAQVWLREHGYIESVKKDANEIDAVDSVEPKKPNPAKKPKAANVSIENEKDPNVAGTNKETKKIISAEKVDDDPASVAANDLYTRIRDLWLKIGCAIPTAEDASFRSIAVAVKECCEDGAGIGMFVDEGGVTITIEGEDISFTMDRSF